MGSRFDLQLAQRPTSDSRGRVVRQMGLARGLRQLLLFAKDPVPATVDQTPSRFGRQFSDHIVPLLNQLSPLLNEQVGSPTGLRSDITRNGEKFAPLIESQLGGDG